MSESVSHWGLFPNGDAKASPLTFENGFDCVKVKFNGHLHLYFERSKFRALQSWVKPTMTIEITLEGGRVVCEYDDFRKFAEILAGLEKALY